MTEPGSPGLVVWLRQQWAALEPWLRQHAVWLAVGGALAVASGFLAFYLARQSTDAQPSTSPAIVQTAPPATEGAPPVVAPGTAPPPQAVPGVPGPVPADAGAERSATVKVAFRTFPARRATVMWGGKRLGVIDRGKPLVIERPRDSGPMDVVIRSPGYLAVYARAYTFDDETVEVRITPVDKKDTIYGYRMPIPPDAGAPPE